MHAPIGEKKENILLPYYFLIDKRSIPLINSLQFLIGVSPFDLIQDPIYMHIVIP